MSKMMKYLIAVVVILCLVKACGGDETVADKSCVELKELTACSHLIYNDCGDCRKAASDNLKLVQKMKKETSVAKQKELGKQMRVGTPLATHTTDFLAKFKEIKKKHEDGEISEKDFSKAKEELFSVTRSLVIAHEIYSPVNFGMARPDVYDMETKLINVFKEMSKIYGSGDDYKSVVEKGGTKFFEDFKADKI